MPQGKRRPWRDGDNTTLIDLWDTVGSVALIAIMMHRTPSSVQTQASRLGLPPRAEQRDRHRRRWQPEDDLQLDRLLEDLRLPEGIPIEAVAKRTGRSVDAVLARIISRHGEDADILSQLVAPPLPKISGPSKAETNGKADPRKKTIEDKAQHKQGKVKKCLKCRKSFFSAGSHNWVCIPCKRSDDWD